jgi:hypothetical protein
VINAPFLSIPACLQGDFDPFINEKIPHGTCFDNNRKSYTLQGLFFDLRLFLE